MPTHSTPMQAPDQATVHGLSVKGLGSDSTVPVSMSVIVLSEVKIITASGKR